MIKSLNLLLFFNLLFLNLSSQQLNSAEILHDIKKLDVLGNILYLAAHPDDENTRFISYCANEKLLNTGYLSLTRGDGGQNLIGTEIREELGIIRTQELLSARRIDKGEQFFTRANDFGYSKRNQPASRIIMPRILRNYLISFAIIGMILLIVNWIDLYLTSKESSPVLKNIPEESSK